jgi:hypothetical protein
MKQLLHSKVNNCQDEETAYRVGENLCQLFIEGLIFRIYKELKKIKHQDKQLN